MKRMLVYKDSYFAPSEIDQLGINTKDVIITGTKIGYLYLKNILKHKTFHKTQE